MVANTFRNDLNPYNPIGAKVYLAATYAELMKSIWFSGLEMISPSPLGIYKELSQSLHLNFTGTANKIPRSSCLTFSMVFTKI